MVTTLTGTWIAELRDGQTVYVSGGSVVSGQVSLEGGDTTLTVSSGAVASGLTNPSSNSQAKWTSVTVLSGGSLADSNMTQIVTYISSGGSVSGNTFNDCQNYFSGGSANGDTLTNGGYFNVSSGAYTTGVNVQSNAVYNAYSGSITNSLDVLNAGTINISAGARTSDTTLISGGAENIYSGGIASGTSLYAGATARLYNDSKDLDAIIGGTETVGQGGSSPGRSAVASSATIISGGTIGVVGGGVTSDVRVESGGSETVYNDFNATAINTTVASGGHFAVWLNGFSINTKADSGSYAVISGNGGGKSPGGTEIVSSGTDSRVTALGGNISVRDGGKAFYDNTAGSGYLGVAGNATDAATAISAIIGSGTHADIGYDAAFGRSGLGITSGGQVDAGGNIYVYQTGSAVSTTVHSGGQETLISSGATASGTIIEAGGMSQLNNYTTELGATVAGTQTVGQGGNSPKRSAVASNSTIVSGGVLKVAGGGVSSDVTILNGGTEYVNNDYNTTAFGTVISSGGQLNVRMNAFAVGSVIHSSGYEIVSSGGFESSAQVLAGGLANEVVSGGLQDVFLMSRGQIQLDYFAFSSSASATIDTSNNVMTIVNGASKTTVQLAGNYVTDNKTDDVLLSRASDGNTIAELICYLEGTRIRTPDGDRAVEDIRIGDCLTTWDWRARRTVSQNVQWVGRKRMTVRHGMPDDEAGYPVRVMQGALADGVPVKDLLITPEHCLFFDGHFVPVRMLVNGRSIAYDRSLTSYDYFHIETENHAVIWADGALSESYLDTGNRRSFVQHGVVAMVAGAPRCWEIDAAAPLATARAIVEPLFRQCEARAKVLGVRSVEKRGHVTHDANIHVRTADGRIITASRIANGHATFRLPDDVTEVRLCSHASRPADAIGPYIDDRRRLGLLVGEVILFATDSTARLSQHLLVADLEGWNALEQPGMRWTTGEAKISLPAVHIACSRLLSINILQAGPYFIENESHVDHKQSSVA